MERMRERDGENERKRWGEGRERDGEREGEMVPHKSLVQMVPTGDGEMEMERDGKRWGDMERDGETWGEIWRDLGRDGERWGDI